MYCNHDVSNRDESHPIRSLYKSLNRSFTLLYNYYTIYTILFPIVPRTVEDLGPLTVKVPMNMLLILAKAACTVFVFRLLPVARDPELKQGCSIHDTN